MSNGAQGGVFCFGQTSARHVDVHAVAHGHEDNVPPASVATVIVSVSALGMRASQCTCGTCGTGLKTQRLQSRSSRSGSLEIRKQKEPRARCVLSLMRPRVPTQVRGDVKQAWPRWHHNISGEASFGMPKWTLHAALTP